MKVSIPGSCIISKYIRIKLNFCSVSRPPKPCSTVPFRRDRDFVDRGELLSQIDQQCSRQAGRAALVGLGGVGKSQLAIEYAHRTRERSPGTWVFWVHASNAARFEQGFRNIADVAKVPGREEPQADMLRLVHDWLRGSEEKWLMILDNVDNADFLINAQNVQPSPLPLRDYLPQSQNGSILLTTRSRKSALRLAEESDIVPIDPMGASVAFELLDKKLESIGQKHDKDLKELAGVLEFMPLAIVQATSYILRLSPRYSVRRYIEEFQKNDRKRSNLLNHEGGELRRDSQAKNSIIITWQISFEHIHETRQSASDLLSLMSFCDPQGIPAELIRYRLEDAGDELYEERNDNVLSSDKDSDSDLSDDDQFEMDVQTLRDFSFISTTSNPSIFQMHRLVQLATRKWLDANEQLEKWKEQYIKILYQRMPDEESKTWRGACRALFPHVKSVAKQRPKRDDVLSTWASLLHYTAQYALLSGKLAEAVELSELAARETKRIYGSEHEATLSRLRLVGQAYTESGRLDEVEEIQLQLVEISKRILGEEHPDTLKQLRDLASTYEMGEDIKKAEDFTIKILEIHKKVLGAYDPSTLTVTSDLASIYGKQEQWTEAQDIEVQVIEMRKKVLGEDHPDTLASISDLALTLSQLEQYEKAEQMLIPVIGLQKELHGEYHPRTMTSTGILAEVYARQGHLEKAAEMYEQIVDNSRRAVGNRNHYTLTKIHKLGNIYRRQERWEKAAESFSLVADMRQKRHGKRHAFTLSAKSNLVLVYRDQKRYEEAEQLVTRIIAIQKKDIGGEHPDTVSNRLLLADIYRGQERWAEAEELGYGATEKQKEVIDAKLKLTTMYKDQGQWQEAIDQAGECYELLQEVYGPEYRSMKSLRQNLEELKREFSELSDGTGAA